jgi:peptide/nickel transport system substrate-binding protein
MAQDLTVTPDILASYTFTDNKTVLTMQLREGMKWSDGAPLTSEDFTFAYTDLHVNEQVATWGGSLADATSVEALGPYTVRATFRDTQPTVLVALSDWNGSDWSAFFPKHYLSKFHIAHNPDADKLAIAAGFKTWVERLAWSLPMTGTQNDLERPTTQPWRETEITSSSKLFERNPYYHVIDTAGNQLPYIDRIAMFVADKETYNLKIIAGEADIAFSVTTLDNFPLYKENEAKGGYKATLIPGPSACDVCLHINQFNPDPVKRALLSDVRFRQALSVAVNRDEINKNLYFGQAVPRQVTVSSSASFFQQRWANNFAQYDPALANRTLDQLGLTRKNSAGIRLMSNGQPLSLTIENQTANEKVLELVKEYWEDVGVETIVKFEERGLWRTRREANVWDVMSEGHEGGEVNLWSGGGSFGISVLYQGPWNQWLTATDQIARGERKLADFQGGVMPGQEPPAAVKRIWALGQEKRTVEPGTADYKRIMTEWFDLVSQQLFMIGTVGENPFPQIADARLGNVATALPVWGCCNIIMNYWANQLYFKQ